MRVPVSGHSGKSASKARAVSVVPAADERASYVHLIQRLASRGNELEANASFLSAIAVPPVPIRWSRAVADAFGILWLANATQGSPDAYPPDHAVLDALRRLSRLLTMQERRAFGSAAYRKHMAKLASSKSGNQGAEHGQ